MYIFQGCPKSIRTPLGVFGRDDKRTKREKERPERAASSQPRATPWVSAYKRLRPVRAKVWANGCFLLLPLQGAGPFLRNPGRCPGLRTCWAFSPCLAADNRALNLLAPVLGRPKNRPPHFASKVSYSAGAPKSVTISPIPSKKPPPP